MTSLDSILKSRDDFANKGPSSQSCGFSSSHVWLWESYYKESWMLKNWCFWTVVLEKTLESPSDCKGIQPVHPKGNQSWVFIGRTDAEDETPILWASWCDELTHLKRPWCWERLKAEGKGDDRGRDGWMASPTQWTWVWVNSGSWWWTGRPSVLQSMVSQRVRHDWATELKRLHFFFWPSCICFGGNLFKWKHKPLWHQQIHQKSVTQFQNISLFTLILCQSGHLGKLENE